MVLDLLVFWRNQLEQSTSCVSTIFILNKKGIIWGFPRMRRYIYQSIKKSLAFHAHDGMITLSIILRVKTNEPNASNR